MTDVFVIVNFSTRNMSDVKLLILNVYIYTSM